MGILRGLFGGTPGPEEAARLVAAGREKLWRRDFAGARRDLSRAGKAAGTAALATAYRSLLRRAQSDVGGAEAEGARAVEADEDCCEAWIAWSLAALTGGDVVAGLGRLGKARTLSPADAEGQFLRLLMMPLWTEAILNAEETADDVKISIRHTPFTRAAVRLLDGEADLAERELAGVVDSVLLEVSRGLVAWRKGDRGAAAKWLGLVAPELTGTEYASAARALLAACGGG